MLIRTRRGLTLPELLVYLLLVGMAAHVAIGPARRQADALVLRGVREEVVTLFHRARMEARQLGEARVRLATGEDPLLLLSEDVVRGRVPLAERGVVLEVQGARDAAELTFGPLGVATFAAATVVLRRGEEEVALVVSGYGRVRR
jgi:type II secretory pathway pseudopilin PulG